MYLKRFVEWVFPSAWKVTHRRYFTTYYWDCTRVGKLTGRVQHRTLTGDWAFEENEY